MLSSKLSLLLNCMEYSDCVFCLWNKRNHNNRASQASSSLTLPSSSTSVKIKPLLNQDLWHVIVAWQTAGHTRRLSLRLFCSLSQIALTPAYHRLSLHITLDYYFILLLTIISSHSWVSFCVFSSHSWVLTHSWLSLLTHSLSLLTLAHWLV
jgi:hypothetical protein